MANLEPPYLKLVSHYEECLARHGDNYRGVARMEITIHLGRKRTANRTHGSRSSSVEFWRRGHQRRGSCPKSVIDDKRFRGNKLRLGGLRGSSPKADDLAASGNPKVPGCLRFGPSRNSCGSECRAGASPCVERPEPFLERRQDSDDDVLLCPEGRRSIWRFVRETQAGSQLQGSKAPQVPLHFSDRSRFKDTSGLESKGAKNRMRQLARAESGESAALDPEARSPKPGMRASKDWNQRAQAHPTLQGLRGIYGDGPVLKPNQPRKPDASR